MQSIEHMQGQHHTFLCRVFLSFSKTFWVVMMVCFIAISNAHAKKPVSVADLAEKLQKSVVNISTRQTVDISHSVPLPNLPKGSPFRDLFKDFFDFDNEQEQGKKPKRRSVQSLGSGFVISKDGFIVTNNHVIDRSDEVIVKFPDGKSYEADVIGRDEKTDIAVLKIEAEDVLVPLEFGDSDKLRVGDWAMAIGNPFGLGGTVTLGIVSARNRDINSGPYDDYIQTDASINRGNSGGPLFDMNGRVIGVNTAIYSPSGGSVGIGFAVPSDTVKKIVGQLIEYGETRRGWLGVRIQEVTDGIKESFKLKKKKGALVANVIEDSPAEKAKFKPGDIILTFNNKDIKSVRDLPIIVAETPVNKNVEVVVWRDGKKKTIKVTLGRLEEVEDKLKEKTSKILPRSQTEDMLGMKLLEINRKLREKYSIDEDTNGLVVVEVEEDSSAYQQGIRVGFVIGEIEGKKVNKTSEARKIVDIAKDNDRKYVLLLVEDLEKQPRFVPIELE